MRFIKLVVVGMILAFLLTGASILLGLQGQLDGIKGAIILVVLILIPVLFNLIVRVKFRRFRTPEYLAHDDEFVKVTARIYAIAKIGMAAGTTDTFETLVGRRPRTMAEWAATSAAFWQRAS